MNSFEGERAGWRIDGSTRETTGGRTQREPNMSWGHEKEEVSEVLMFSGPETQSEITLLLDELYGDLSSRDSLDRAGGERRDADKRRQAREEGLRPLRAEVKLAVVS